MAWLPPSVVCPFPDCGARIGSRKCLMCFPELGRKQPDPNTAKVAWHEQPGDGWWAFLVPEWGLGPPAVRLIEFQR
jgi:hypothetical protein